MSLASVDPVMRRSLLTRLGVVVLAGTLATGCAGAGPSNTSDRASAKSPSAEPGTPDQAQAGGLFTAPEPWTSDVSASVASDRSDAIVAALNGAGGWGNDNVFQTDFSITVFEADASTPRVERSHTALSIARQSQQPFGDPTAWPRDREGGRAAARR
jgi:hypothetical protein